MTLQNSFWERPALQFRSLPLDIRWEATRRHPSYQAFWKRFNVTLDVNRVDEETQRYAESLIETLAQIVLNAICIGGERPDPALGFESLSESALKSGWMSGAVVPLTNRQLLCLLMTKLPKDTLGKVGVCILNAGAAKDIGEEPRQLQELRNLAGLESEGLDDYTENLVSINPAASSRDINNALSQLLVEWKGELGLSEQRVPSKKKLKAYLKVWDMREGWISGHYDRSKESSFREIAKLRNDSIKTIHNQYKSAFKLITGHEYSVNNWVELFGHLKLSDVFGNLGRAACLRPLVEKTRRAIPESVVSSGSLPNFISMNAGTTEPSSQELLSRITQLISMGKSDAEIATEMEMPHPELLPALRDRISAP